MDFADSLKVKMGEIEKPPQVPAGFYAMEVSKTPQFIKRGAKDEWLLISFPMKGIEEQEGVDEEDLAEFGGIKAVFIQKEFMLNQDGSDEAEVANAKTWYRIKVFIEDHLQVDTDGMDKAEALEASIGAQCIVEVTWSPNTKEPGEFYVNAGKSAPLDD